jgi:3-oxoacyl-[acyl-carrier-protein] synthase-3
MKARIAHIAYYLPEKEFSNEDFFTIFPKERDLNSYGKLGIQNRHVCVSDETSSDLAVKAAEILFEQSGFDKNKIDFLIFNSPENDYYTPSTSCVIQGILGLKDDIGTIDLTHGCSGYTYSLSVAKGIIESGQAENILVLNASSLTKTFHPMDKASRFVFGDAGSATWIKASEGQEGIGSFVFGTRGSDFERIIIRDGMGRNPIRENSFSEKADEFGNVFNDACFRMDGTGVFYFSMNTVPDLVKKILVKNNIDLSEVDEVVLHQANSFMLEFLRKKIGIEKERFFNSIERSGNTVACTIPIALKELMNTGKISPGKKVLVAGFGTGLSWSGTIIHF